MFVFSSAAAAVIFAIFQIFQTSDKMPRVAHKACCSLKQLCLQNICTHIDTLWCKNFLDLYYKNAHWIYILGPFDSLPPNLIQAIRTVGFFHLLKSVTNLSPHWVLFIDALLLIQIQDPVHFWPLDPDPE